MKIILKVLVSTCNLCESSYSCSAIPYHGRAGRIDLVARKGKFRVAVEYDHYGLIKWKSFQKIVQIKPDVAIAITGNGNLGPNLERAEKYRKI